uniref:Uncharacterized protein n=1 Tax=Anguilla anguilla TaxID=7936 RepID=A0A0E9WCT5_ANGAN
MHLQLLTTPVYPLLSLPSCQQYPHPLLLLSRDNSQHNPIPVCATKTSIGKE